MPFSYLTSKSFMKQKPAKEAGLSGWWSAAGGAWVETLFTSKLAISLQSQGHDPFRPTISHLRIYAIVTSLYTQNDLGIG